MKFQGALYAIIFLSLSLFGSDRCLKILQMQVCCEGAGKMIRACGRTLEIMLSPSEQNYDTCFEYACVESEYPLESISHLGDNHSGESLKGDLDGFQKQINMGYIFLMIQHKTKGGENKGLPSVPPMSRVKAGLEAEGEKRKRSRSVVVGCFWTGKGKACVIS